jgi:hypothetical protein
MFTKPSVIIVLVHLTRIVMAVFERVSLIIFSLLTTYWFVPIMIKIA